ncbi:MAG: beta-propeller fold lactonase family protein [Propionibacterium sp.]|nr:beta-propeller fold lactonase family protein [Propionibacterium sp.]
MTTLPLVLIGNAKGGTIAAFHVADDALRPAAITAVGEGCGTFAIDDDLVYSAVRQPSPAIVTLRLDRADGTLTEISRREVEHPLAYIAVARDGDLVLAASYHGGWGATWDSTDGVLSEPTSRVVQANMHAVVPTADSRHAYYVSLGDDRIIVQSLIDGSTTTVSCAEGSGPRHLVLSDDQRSAYLMTEFTGEAIRFDRDPDTGNLTQAESVEGHDPARALKTSRFGADPLGERLIWGADLHLAGEGKWLLTSERTESTITTIALDDGRLGDAVHHTDTETQPRGFVVSPDGGRAVVVGERSGQATLYNVLHDGTLSALDRVETGEGPNWVRFA